MLNWVQYVWKHYFLEVPVHVDSLLLLDSYKCHMIALIIMRISELSV